MKTHTVFDAVIVLCGSIARDPSGTFVPTSYDDSDDYGMLGGAMRVIAAALLYVNRRSSTFVFSAGKSEKTIARLGPDVPAEAGIYRSYFQRMVRELSKAHLDPPTLLLEDRTPNTVQSLQACFAMIESRGWKQVAILSADYHIPRVKALSGLILQDRPLDAKLAFLSAETVAQELAPDRYDQTIDAAYRSPQAIKRLKNEARSLEHIRNGTYYTGEFQLHESGAPIEQ